MMDRIRLKSPKEIEAMRLAGKITAAARALAGEMVRPGVATRVIDEAVRKYILSQGAVPTFLGYGGYPASTCISVNEEVIHGIPGSRKLEEGDVVSIDVGATKNGFVGDCAATFIAGQGSEEAKRLIEVTRMSFFKALEAATSGNRITDISEAVQQYVEANGYSVIRDYVGHGVGKQMHEPPEVPNFVDAIPERRVRARLMPGMTIAIEPMVAQGNWQVRSRKDGWTVVTADRKLAAHYENTVLITDGKPEILTRCDGEQYEGF